MLLLLFLALLPWPELPVQRWIKVGRITIFVLFMISSRYMRLHIYHCLRPAELGFLQALMLPAKSTIIKGKIGPRRLGHIQLELSVITDKIISLVTSNCRSVGFHLRTQLLCSWGHCCSQWCWELGCEGPTYVSWRTWSLAVLPPESRKYFYCHVFLRQAPRSPRRKAGVFWAHWCQLSKEDVIQEPDKDQPDSAGIRPSPSGKKIFDGSENKN